MSRRSSRTARRSVPRVLPAPAATTMPSYRVGALVFTAADADPWASPIGHALAVELGTPVPAATRPEGAR